MREHHRDIAFRPPRRIEGGGRKRSALMRRFLGGYFRPYWKGLLLGVLLVSLNACSVYMIAYYTRIVVDHVLEIEPERDPPAVTARPGSSGRGRVQRPAPAPPSGGGRRFEPGVHALGRRPQAARRLVALFGVYLATVVSLNLLTRLATRIRIRVGKQVTGKLRDDLHRKVLDLSLAFHRIYTPGRLLARIVSDIEVVQQQMLVAIFMGTRCAALIIVGLVILLTVEWRFGMVMLAMLPLYAGIMLYYRPRVRRINQELRHTNSCLYSLVGQKLDAIKAIQAYHRERLEHLFFHRLAACFLRDAVAQNRLSATLGFYAQAFSACGAGIAFVWGAINVMDGRLSLGELLFLYATASTLFAPALQITHLSVIFNNLFVVMGRVARVLDEPPAIEDPPDAQPMPRPLRKGINMENITFRYPVGESAPAVMRDMSLFVPAGSWLCLMGPSGAGKTSLLYLLARLYEPEQGRILYDDLPLERIAIASLRSAMGLVPQEAQIFSGTVRENICYGYPRAEPREIMAAARAAELHDFIMTMPVQYETMLGEKGVSLSGGQRQRLSLARALLTDPEILLLDDCTSALDAHTEYRIQRTLAHVLRNRTAVMVSQRVSMAKRCDRIVVLDGGSIIEAGTHDELVDAGGFYSRLHRQQTE